MDYKVDKKSFYNMMSELFNHVYGKEFTDISHEITEGYDFLNRDKEFPKNKDICFCKFEEYYLKCDDGRELFQDKRVIKSEIKEGFILVNPIVTPNDNFVVNSGVDEIAELVAPYIFEFPFLVNLPSVINCLAFTNSKDGIVKFDEETLDCIKEVFKEYKVSDDQNRDFMLTRIRTMKED